MKIHRENPTILIFYYISYFVISSSSGLVVKNASSQAALENDGDGFPSYIEAIPAEIEYDQSYSYYGENIHITLTD